MWNDPPTRILVPVDFGAASARALRVAAAIAGTVHADIIALHAEPFEAPPYFTPEQIGRLERERIAAQRAAEEYVRDFVRTAGTTAATIRIRPEQPADAILASSSDADLIVMGTHGRRGPRRWWLGSVAEQVVLESRVPVLVVREAPETMPATGLFSNVLIAAGEVGFTSPVGRYGQRLPTAFGGRATEVTAADLADAARTAAGTLLVVAKAARPDEAWFGDLADRLLRGCTMPLLFVPA